MATRRPDRAWSRPGRQLERRGSSLRRGSVIRLDEESRIRFGHQLEGGSGADRQLQVFHETNDLKKVVDYMISETEYGLFDGAAG